MYIIRKGQWREMDKHHRQEMVLAILEYLVESGADLKVVVNDPFEDIETKGVKEGWFVGSGARGESLLFYVGPSAVATVGIGVRRRYDPPKQKSVHDFCHEACEEDINHAVAIQCKSCGEIVKRSYNGSVQWCRCRSVGMADTMMDIKPLGSKGDISYIFEGSD